MQTSQQDSFLDVREAVRDLCQRFSGEYFRKPFARVLVDKLVAGV
jgi:hypothetical protein